MSNYCYGGFWINQHPEDLNRTERDLQQAFRALGYRVGYLDYQIQRDMALTVLNGKPAGRYDLTRHTFVE
jgi:hypothetical protein